MKIHKNDQVMVIAGKDRGKKGKVIQTLSAKSKVLVEDVNKKKKFIKKTERAPGQILENAYPVDVSNVMLICPLCGKATRVGHSAGTDGKKARACKKCHESFK